MSVKTEITVTVEEAKEIIHKHLVQTHGLDVDRIESFGFWSEKQEEANSKPHANLFLMKIDGMVSK